MPSRAIVATVLVLAASSIAAAQGEAFYAVPQFARHVAIVYANGQGSGYYVRGEVQTAAHVVGSAPAVMVGAAHGRVTCADPETDSAVVEVEVAGPPLSLSPSRASPRERVTVAGWRRGSYTEVSTVVARYGSFAAVVDQRDVAHVVGPYLAMYSTGDNLGGMSGGPVVNALGQVLGTLVASSPVEMTAIAADGAACRARSE